MEVVDLENKKTLTIQVDGSKKKGTIPWLLVGAAAVLALVLGIKLSSWFIVKQRQRQQRRQCAAMEPLGAVYVLLYNHNDSRQTAATVMSAVRNASCSKNTYVAVYQELGGGEHDVYDYLERMVRTGEESYWINNNIGIVSVDHTSVGHLWAIKELVQRRIFVHPKWCLLVQALRVVVLLNKLSARCAQKGSVKLRPEARSL